MLLRLLQLGGFLAATVAISLSTASAQDFVPFGPGDGASIPDFNEANDVPGSAISTITILENDSVTISDLSVCIDGLTHTWAGDLIATVTHTDTQGNNTVATLFNRIGKGPFAGDGDASNFDGDYEFASTGASLWTESAQGSSGNGTQGTIDDEFVIAPGTYANVNSLGFDNNTSAGSSTTSLAAIFGGSQSAGTWTIRLTDNDVNDLGSFERTRIKFASVAAVPEPGTVGLMAVASIGGFFYIRRKKKKTSPKSSEQLSS